DALILCDLQQHTRQEAAALLGLPEGTLSSRLATARRMLGERLARRGASLAVVALPAVPAALASSTSFQAALVAARRLAAAESSAASLAKGVLKAMILTKVKLALAVVLTVGFLSGVITFRPAALAPAVAQPGVVGSKPISEVEALRKEVELLQVNLRVVLEKVRALEAENAALKGATPKAATKRPADPRGSGGGMARYTLDPTTGMPEPATRPSSAAKTANLTGPATRETAPPLLTVPRDNVTFTLK